MAKFFDYYEGQRIRYLIYGAVWLVLWVLLVADILFILGLWDGSPPIYATTLYLLVIVGYTSGPVITFESRLWRRAQIKAQREERRRQKLIKYPVERYHSIILVCYKCGWQRMIGYSGCYKNARALIHIKPAKSGCNVLSAVILKAPSDVSVETLIKRYPYFRDIRYDIQHNYRQARRPYLDLLRHKPCPRCKQQGKLNLYLQLLLSNNLDELSKHRSWRIINLIEKSD